MLKENKYECDVCHEEFSAEDAESQIGIHFKEQNVTVCNECLVKSVRENYVKALEAGNVPVNTLVADPVFGLQAEVEKDNAVKAKVKQLQAIVAKETPAKIKAHLDQFIVGQNDAKMALASGVYNHYKRLSYEAAMEMNKKTETPIPDSFPTRIKKSNLLMVGPSGTGKTALLEAISKYLDVPFAVTDASSLTEAGYVGQDVETCVKNLWEAAGRNIEKTERGIIYLDEFDKLARKSGTNPSTTSDPGHEGVQQALLKLIEGSRVSFNPGTARRNPDMPAVYIDTTNILFICGGAFEGIDDIIDKRLSENNGFGFGRKEVADYKDEENQEKAERFNKLISKAKPEDFVTFGMLTEVMGRLPIICKLQQLTSDDLCHIMTQPKDAIVKQYNALFQMDNSKLTFKEDALKKIADIAIENGTGARALRTMVENILLKTMYRLPDLVAENKTKTVEVVVTEESIDTCEPEIVYADKAA